MNRPVLPFLALLAAAWILSASPAAAQVDSAVYGRASAARTDLAVPDAPAFSIMDEQITDIMRPSTVREVAILVSRFLEGGSGVPQALALEVAPALLIKGTDLSLSEYRKNAWLYRTRISVASSPGSSGGTKLAAGARFTFVDRSDLRTDDQLLDQLYEVGRQINDVQAEAKLRFRGNPLAFDTLSAVEKQAVEDLMSAFVDSAMGSKADETIFQAREDARRRLWNAQILEMGLAGRWSSPDSTSGKSLAEADGMSPTWTLPPGTPGMILIGGNGRLERDAAYELELFTSALALRAYVGANDFKGFLEGGGAWASDLQPQVSANLGGELRLFGGFWLDATIGVEAQGGQGPFVRTAWNVRFATPELSE
jgi:hypothetical protein